jgi:hypothetical protein
VLAVREGGEATARLRIRNCGNGPGKGAIDLGTEHAISVTPATIDLSGWSAGEEKVVDVAFKVKAGTPRHLVWHYAPEGDGINLQRAELVVGHHVAAVRNRHSPVDGDVHIFAPRYHTKMYPLVSGGFTVMIDPEGKRVDMTEPPYPQLKVFSEEVDRKTKKTNTVSRTESLRPYVQFFPMAYSEEAKKEGWLEERDQWQHEGAPFKYRFETDWIALQYYQAKHNDTFIQVNWWSLTPIDSNYRRAQEGYCKAYVDGKVVDLPANTRGGISPQYQKGMAPPSAVFVKNKARDYGMVQFFAAGSQMSEGRHQAVDQPIDGWFGLAFCKEDEFEVLAKKWVAVREKLDVE